jgi:hypothetical protein
MRLPHEVLRDRLTVYLGPNTARVALKTFAHRSVGVAPEDMTPEQTKLLLEALRPMLKTLLGAAQSDRLVANITIEMNLHT